MLLYLDNCCFNRPFDDQNMIRIKLEAEAKLYIQEKIRQRQLKLAWSYVLDFENNANPFEERKKVISEWKNNSVVDSIETKEVIVAAMNFKKYGFKSKDALHIACAVCSKCDYFVTTDDDIIKGRYKVTEVRIVDPVTFIREVNI